MCKAREVADYLSKSKELEFSFAVLGAVKVEQHEPNETQYLSCDSRNLYVILNLPATRSLSCSSSIIILISLLLMTIS